MRHNDPHNWWIGHGNRVGLVAGIQRGRLVTINNPFINGSTVNYTTTSAQTVSIQETSTLVASESVNLQVLTVRVPQ